MLCAIYWHIGKNRSHEQLDNNIERRNNRSSGHSCSLRYALFLKIKVLNKEDERTQRQIEKETLGKVKRVIMLYTCRFKKRNTSL